MTPDVLTRRIVDGDGREKLVLLGDLMILSTWTVGPLLLAAALKEAKFDGCVGREG